jgi:hypothetical protein
LVLVSNIFGAATAAKIPTIKTTTTNSTKLKARRNFETLDFIPDIRMSPIHTLRLFAARPGPNTQSSVNLRGVKT